MEHEQILQQIIFKWECGWGVSDIAEQMSLEYALVYSIVMAHIEKMQT